MFQETLESKSLWYKYKKHVWSQNSAQTAVVHNIMRTLRAIRNSRDFAYVSAPITTGKFFYKLKLQRPLIKKEKLLSIVGDHNYGTGWKFVEDVRRRRNCPILYPADLIPARQKWSQIHFQALWLSIIAEKCTEIHMSKDWEFSEGCCQEFTHVMQLRLGLPDDKNLFFFNTKEDEKEERERMRNINAYDHQGNLLSPDEGVEAIKNSSEWLKRHSIESQTLKNCLQLLHWTKKMINQGFYR